MIRVCHMTSAHTAGDNRVFRKECRTLARAGYAVWYVVPGESGEKDGVHIVGTGEMPRSRFKRMAGWARHTYQVARALDCDVYHFHDTELLPYGKRLAKQGKLVIFDSHECYPLLMYEKEYIPACLRGLVSRLYKAYETGVVRRLAAVVIPFTVDGRDVFAGRARRTLILDNLPELASFPAELPPKGEGAEGRVGYFGRLSESRGITQLVQACGMANARLLLAGPVPAEYLARLQKMPEFDLVECRGPFPYTAVPEMCAQVSVGMGVILDVGQHFRMDNLITKIYEYGCMGLPVILSDTAPAKRFLAEYDCGLCVDPADPAAIARAIRTLLDDPALAKRMGEAGRRAALEKYNWETEGKKLVALYDELTGGPAAPVKRSAPAGAEKGESI